MGKVCPVVWLGFVLGVTSACVLVKGGEVVFFFLFDGLGCVRWYILGCLAILSAD